MEGLPPADFHHQTVVQVAGKDDGIPGPYPDDTTIYLPLVMARREQGPQMAVILPDGSVQVVKMQRVGEPPVVQLPFAEQEGESVGVEIRSDQGTGEAYFEAATAGGYTRTPVRDVGPDGQLGEIVDQVEVCVVDGNALPEWLRNAVLVDPSLMIFTGRDREDMIGNLPQCDFNNGPERGTLVAVDESFVLGGYVSVSRESGQDTVQPQSQAFYEARVTLVEGEDNNGINIAFE